MYDIDIPIVHSCSIGAGTRHTNDITIEFEIQLNFAMLFFITHSTDYNTIVHMSQKQYFRDGCEISLWSYEPISNQRTAIFIELRIQSKYR